MASDGLGPPQRQTSLESQQGRRPKRKWVLPQWLSSRPSSRPNDIIEQFARKARHQLPRLKTDDIFIEDYARFSSRLATHTSRSIYGDILKRYFTLGMFHVAIVPPFTSRCDLPIADCELCGASLVPIITLPQPTVDSLASLLSDFVKLSGAFDRPKSDGLQLCVFVTEPYVPTISQHFSFFDKLIASVRRDHDYLYRIPHRAMELLLIYGWRGAHPFIFLSDFYPAHKTEPINEATLEQPDPDLGIPVVEGSKLYLPSSGPLAGPSSIYRFSWDHPYCLPNYSFAWQASSPSFKTDLDVYIWESWRAEAPCRTAKFYLTTSLNADRSISKSSKVLITINNVFTLDAFSREYHLQHAALSQTSNSGNLAHFCSLALSEHVALLSALLAIYKALCSDTVEFVKHCFAEVERMKLIGRRDPSPSKVHFLVHLDDCREVAVSGVSDAMEVLSNLKDDVLPRPVFSLLPEVKAAILQECDVNQKDLEYLLGKLDEARVAIKDRQDMIREHLSLTQDRRVFILTVLAALYLPLSLVCGLLGMNITVNPPGDFSGFSNFTNTTLHGLPSDTRNATAAILSTISSSGSYMWEWKYFGIIAGPLMLTVPLSVLVGGFFRWSVRSAAIYRHLWRIGILVLAPILWLGIYLLLPSFGQFPGYVVYVVLNVLTLGLYAIYRFYNAMLSREGRWKWTGFLLLVSLCLVFDLTIIDFTIISLGPVYGDPLMLLPYLYLLVIWFRGYRLERDVEMTKDKEQRGERIRRAPTGEVLATPLPATGGV